MKSELLQAQVNYWTLVENKRHNLVTEDVSYKTLAENARHNLETESQGWASINETKRHNLATEELGWSNLEEAQRHNLATEFESQRHNVAGESETIRHNTVTERQQDINLAENERSHRANERIGWANAAASQMSAQAAQRNAEIKYGEYLWNQTRWSEEYDLRSKANEIAETNANTNWWNAMNNIAGTNVAQENAETNAQNAATAYYNAETQRWEFYLDTGKTVSEEARNWYTTLFPKRRNGKR